MNHINRLLIKARQEIGGKGKLILGFVRYDRIDNKFIVHGTIWDGFPGSHGEKFYSEHDTEEEAEAACDAVVAQCPNAKQINFITEYFLEDLMP